MPHHSKHQPPPNQGQTTAMYANPSYRPQIVLDPDAYVARPAFVNSTETMHALADNPSTYSLFLTTDQDESSSDSSAAYTIPPHASTEHPIIKKPIHSTSCRPIKWLLWPQQYPYLANLLILLLIISTIVLAILSQREDSHDAQPTACDPDMLNSRHQASTALTSTSTSLDTTDALRRTQASLLSTTQQSITTLLSTAAPTFFAYPPTGAPSLAPSRTPSFHPSNHPTSSPTTPIRADLAANATAWNGMTLVQQNTFCRSIYGSVGGASSCGDSRTDHSRCCELGGCGACQNPSFSPTSSPTAFPIATPTHNPSHQPTDNPTDTTTGAPVAAGRVDLGSDSSGWDAMTGAQQDAFCTSIYGGVGGSLCTQPRNDHSRCCDLGGCGGCPSP